jgi:hypothetical protein
LPLLNYENNWIYPFVCLIVKKWEDTFCILLYRNKRKISVYYQDETGKLYKANQFRLDCLGLFLIDQRCTNSGRHFTRATKFCMVTPGIYGSSLRNLRHITLFAPLIFNALPGSLENLCTPALRFFRFPRPETAFIPSPLGPEIFILLLLSGSEF